MSILPLRLENVVYAAGNQRLIDGITAEFTGGMRTVVLGPNGAGKSLLLRLCHGLIQPTGGRLAWHGGGADIRHRQAMVFQRPVMLRRSAGGNIDLALALRGMARGDRAQRTALALARTGLSALAERPARVLSVGEQQRLALARAWALQPDVLFLDEPTASLDTSATRAVEAIIDAIHDAGTKIVMTTHDHGQARRFGDDVLFLHRGRLVERAPGAQFFDRPQTELAGAFLRGDLLW